MGTFEAEAAGAEAMLSGAVAAATAEAFTNCRREDDELELIG
jgi:hypothetical protein